MKDLLGWARTIQILGGEMVSVHSIKRAKILIVDDQETNVVLMEKLLKLSGYTSIYTTTDSRNVLQMFQEIKPDLILLDIRMPHIDGFGVLQQLNEVVVNNYLPVLVLTAQSDMDTRLKALEMGAKDFLEKPFDRIEALTRIHNMLEVRLLQNEVKNQNLLLEEKVLERTQELINTQREILRRLGKASEYRDDDTGFHINRMSHYCQLLAKAAGLSDQFCNMILDISAMHDIGKIGIPDSILLKPDRLNDQEFDIMKKHTIIGADILSGSNSPILRLAESMALTHHERWDGTGYPNQLIGENIPIEGRICAISDVFDALTSCRPYKQAWTIESAVTEMKKGRERHFDPELLDEFLHILPQIEEIKEQFSNVNLSEID